MTGEGGSFMADLRSGLCHGPDCEAEITDGSESEDFCGDECQTRWNASHADPPMPPLSINLPGPSLARWTPEGGAPITPETSTWQPTRVSWVPEIADLEHPTTAELMGGVRLDGFLVESAPIALVMEPGDLIEVTGQGDADGTYRVLERTGASSYKVMPDDEEPEVGEAAAQSPTRRSWFSRLWRWMWLRG
jgi:hypothetical protein